ncbi:MAG: hypothetical protein ACRYFS_11640 [Janthinobacterium lividum]
MNPRHLLITAVRNGTIPTDMLNDPLWKRALKAVVEIKDPPPPPPPEPSPQSSYDELDGALKMQERRESRQRLNPVPTAAAAPVDASSPVDADGLVDFEKLYGQAGVPTVPFTAEQALDMLHNMPSGVSEDTRQQIINVTLSALGKSVGGTPEAIVADATRKQAALQRFRQTRGDQLADLTSAAQAHLADLQKEIAKSQAIIENAKRQYTMLSENCQSEEARLDTVVDFFSDTPAPH